MSAVDAILPHEPMTVTLDLPFPPSVNHTLKRGKHGVYLAPKYRAWIKNADAHRMLQRPGLVRTIAVPFEAHILLNADAGIGDVDNRIKCLMDYAQRIEIIKNDKLCRKVTAEWVIASQAPYGARVIIKELA